MCKGQPEQPQTGAPANKKLFLASVDSFIGDDKGFPSRMSMVFTSSIIIAFLVMIELTLRQVFISFQHLHPLLEDETNRNILARHIGVDSISCFAVTYLGWKARHVVQDVVDAAWFGKNSMPKAYEGRMFQYRPESARITLFFFAYQLKNTYDTIVWNDGPEFVLHHMLTLFTAWGALHPGSAHFYAPFYFGISELSTAILCLLANFDDDHGVKGLGEAFPMGKVAFGAIFALAFIVCRVFMWSTVSYYYCRDAWNALSGNDPRLTGRKMWLRFTFVSLSLLSLLQIIWLAEIFRVGYVELKKVGLV